MKTFHRRIGIALLLFSSLFVVTAPSASASTSYTFSENFKTRKYEDMNKTTAFWDVDGGRVSLQPIDISSVRIDSPGNAVYQIISCGSYWIFDAGIQVFAYDGTTVSNLTSYVYPYGILNRDEPGIACGKNNIAYLHYSAYDPATNLESQVLQQYDGTSVSAVSVDFGSISNTQLKMSQENIDGNLYFSTTGGNLYVFDGTSIVPVTQVSSESDLGAGDVGLVHFYPGGLFKIIGQKALNITSQTGMRRVRSVSKIGNLWYIGGDPNPDDLRSLHPNSFLVYDGTTFTNLTDLAPNGAREVVGSDKNLLALIEGDIYRFDGKKIKLYYSQPSSAGSIEAIGWNGSYWLVGSFLNINGYNGLYRIDPKQSDTDTVQSKTVDKTKAKIRSASLSIRDSISGNVSAASTSIKPKIVYYLSNNGGKTWKKVVLGKKTVFTTTGSDLRWKAVMTKGSKKQTVAINKLTIKY